jgi:hypothetical protein
MTLAFWSWSAMVVKAHASAASSPGCTSDGFNAFQYVQQEFWGRTSDRPLILGAGEGTTATTALQDILHKAFGLRVLHYLTPSPLTKERRQDGKRTVMKVLTTSPNDFARLNLKQLIGDYDAILDTPTTQIFPFLLAAFPRARVIHTVRDSLAWVKSRSANHAGAPKPLAGLQGRILARPHGAQSIRPPSGFENAAQLPNRSHLLASAILYSAQNAYFRCITPPQQYMLVNAFAGELCEPTFLARMGAFIGKSQTNASYVVPNCGRHRK